jgi:short-subunit dehydrogenase
MKARKRKFKGKIIVITGASSGIGRQAALDFVNEDAGSIILIARSESKLLELKRTLQVVNEPKRELWHFLVTYQRRKRF